MPLAMSRSRRLIPLVSVFLLAVLPGTPARADEVPKWFESADEAGFMSALRAVLVRAGDLDGLLAALEQRAGEAPPPSALFERRFARVCRIEGHLRRALKHLDGLEGVRIERAEVLELLGDERACAAYRELWESEDEPRPVRTRAALRLHALLLDGGRIEDAGELARAMLEGLGGEPQRAALADRLAREQALYGAFDGALDLERGAGATQRERYYETMRRAAWLRRAGHPAAALEELSDALELAPSRRERRYVLGLQVAAARICRKGTLAELARTWERDGGTDADMLHAALGVYRETLDRKAALALLEAGARGAEMPPGQAAECVRLLVEMGEQERAEELLRERLGAHPRDLEVRVALARWLIQSGRRPAAATLFEKALAAIEPGDLQSSLWKPLDVLEVLRAARELRLDEVVRRQGERLLAGAIPSRLRADVGILLAELEHEEGHLDEAVARLVGLRRTLAQEPKLVLRVAEAFERLGMPREAVAAYEIALALRRSDSVSLRLGWLLAELGDVEEALSVFEKLWRSAGTDSIRRQAAEQLLTLSANQGRLGDLAVDLEEELDRKPGDEAVLALLVQLYTRAKDGETVEELLREYDQAAGGQVAALRKMSEVYLELDEYRRYEETLHKLLDLDPANAGEIWMQLAMSALERGNPRDARAALDELLKAGGQASLGYEFAGGVYEIVAEHNLAAQAYRRALASAGDHIETLLLWARALSKAGQRDKALHCLLDRLGEEIPDDLFTVALDGLLNLEARGSALRVAARRVRARLARSPRKMYLYELLADLEEALGRKDRATAALRDSLVVAGERRGVLLRELFERLQGGGDRKAAIEVGYLLVGLREQQPPRLYLDLGKLLVEEKAYEQAEWVFSLARDAENYIEVQLDVAGILRGAGRYEQAEQVYRRLLVERPRDGEILLALAQVLELDGKGAESGAIYRGFALEAIQRLPLLGRVETGRSYASNLSDFQRSGSPAIEGALNSFSGPDQGLAWLKEVSARTLSTLSQVVALPDPPRALAESPRLSQLFELCKRLAWPYGAFERLQTVEERILGRLELPSQELIAILRGHLQAGDLGGYQALAKLCRERHLVQAEQMKALVAIERRIERSGGADEPRDPAELVRFVPWYLLEGRVGDLERALDGIPAGAGEEGSKGQRGGGLSDRDRLYIELALGRDERARAVLERSIEKILEGDPKRIYNLRSLLQIGWHLLPDARRQSLFERVEELVRSIDAPNTSHCQILTALARRLGRTFQHEDWWLAVASSNKYALNSALEALEFFPLERRVTLLLRGAQDKAREQLGGLLRSIAQICAGVHGEADLEQLRSFGASLKFNHPAALGNYLNAIVLDPPGDLGALRALLEGVVQAQGIKPEYAVSVAFLLRRAGEIERARELIRERFSRIVPALRRAADRRNLIAVFAPDALEELRGLIAGVGSQDGAIILAADLARRSGRDADARELEAPLLESLPAAAGDLAARQQFYAARGLQALVQRCIEARLKASSENLRSVASQLAEVGVRLRWPRRSLALLAGDRQYSSLFAALRLAGASGDAGELLRALRDYIQFRRGQYRGVGAGAVIYLGGLPAPYVPLSCPAARELLRPAREDRLAKGDLLELAMRIPAARTELLNSFFWSQSRMGVRFGSGPSPLYRGMAIEVSRGGAAGEHFRRRLARNPWDRQALRVLSATPPEIDFPGRAQIFERYLKLELALGLGTVLSDPALYSHRLEQVDARSLAAFIRWSIRTGNLGRSFGAREQARARYRLLRDFAARKGLGAHFVAAELLKSWTSPFGNFAPPPGLLREMAADLDRTTWLAACARGAFKPRGFFARMPSTIAAISARIHLKGGDVESCWKVLAAMLAAPGGIAWSDLATILNAHLEAVEPLERLAARLAEAAAERPLDRLAIARVQLALAWRLAQEEQDQLAERLWRAARGLNGASERLVALDLAWKLGHAEQARTMALELAGQGALPATYLIPWAERFAAAGPAAELDFLERAAAVYGDPALQARFIRRIATAQPARARAALARILAEWPRAAGLAKLQRELSGS